MSTSDAIAGDGAPAPSPRPTLRLICGTATPAEIAAILVIVAARAGSGARPVGTDDDRADTWAAHGHAHRHIRAAFRPSLHGWKTSYWPS